MKFSKRSIKVRKMLSNVLHTKANCKCCYKSFSGIGLQFSSPTQKQTLVLFPKNGCPGIQGIHIISISNLFSRGGGGGGQAYISVSVLVRMLYRASSSAFSTQRFKNETAILVLMPKNYLSRVPGH